MKEIYTGLEDHLDLLKKRGFTEAALNMKAKPGFIADAFTKGFYDLYFAGFENEFANGAIKKSTPEFTLIFQGAFDDKKDSVIFNIKYKYNFESGGINMRFLIAHMGEFKVDQFVNEKTPLQHSKDVYNELCSLRGQKVYQMLEQKRNTVRHTSHRI